ARARTCSELDQGAAVRLDPRHPVVVAPRAHLRLDPDLPADGDPVQGAPLDRLLASAALDLSDDDGDVPRDDPRDAAVDDPPHLRVGPATRPHPDPGGPDARRAPVPGSPEGRPSSTAGGDARRGDPRVPERAG